MPTPQSPLSQGWNSTAARSIGIHVEPKLKSDSFHISAIDDSSKENRRLPIIPIQSKKRMELSSEIEQLVPISLAEELNAVRDKIQRLKIDGEKTETVLKERDLLLDNQMKELEWRGELQKQLESEVDRLYRLKQLGSRSYMRISPIRSLREKENGRNAEERSDESFKPK